MRLQDKVIIITGGAKGMGESHAKLMVSEGAKVVLTDVDAEAGQAVASQLGDDNALFIKQDVSNQDDWHAVIEQTIAKFGRIDGLVNNAGVSSTGTLATMDEAEYMRLININQKSVFLGTKLVAEAMKAQNSGSIVNVSSIAGLVGLSAGYTDSKFAVRGLSKSAAVELAEHNIRVNSVHPGVIVTPMVQDPAIAPLLENIKQAIPLRRFAESIEVSYLVLFLLSEEASYITGAELTVDGGYTAQ